MAQLKPQQTWPAPHQAIRGTSQARTTCHRHATNLCQPQKPRKLKEERHFMALVALLFYIATHEHN